MISSASSLATPSLTAFGAPSTRSLASLRPRPVMPRTSLMTLIFLSPAEARITSNSVFSSAAAAPAAAPPAAATATGAAAETPHSSSSILESSAASRTVSLESSSTSALRSAILLYS
ncbi:50S ribosomal protein L7/L12 [Thalassospira profundimaris WP0211]|nr:50S ribosomal protein L7/L12 [Thalassospira profundimaris WP0211]